MIAHCSNQKWFTLKEHKTLLSTFSTMILFLFDLKLLNKQFYTPIYKFISACIPTLEGTDQCRSYCPKKCRAGYSCKNGCPVCQDGWMGRYCEKRKDISLILLLLLLIILLLPMVNFQHITFGDILPRIISKSFGAIEFNW